MEYMIGIHPKAILEFNKLSDELKVEINEHIAGYKSPVEFYINKLATSIAMLAVAFKDKPVIHGCCACFA